MAWDERLILIIDNYDSFTYNLYQQVLALTNEMVQIVRNDALLLDNIKDLNPTCIILSPGPGRPDESGICIEVIRILGVTIPILGVCLGHQAIAISFSAQVIRAKNPLHGKGSKIFHTNGQLFENIKNGFIAARYHSLVIDESTLNGSLIIDAVDENKEIMAIHHCEYPIYGIQFHPESILTLDGDTIMRNFLEIAHVKTIS